MRSSKRKLSIKRKFAFLSAIAISPFVRSVHADTARLDNGGSPTNIWLIAGNWDNDQVPDSTYDVVIDRSLVSPGATLSLLNTNAAGDAEANSLTLGSGNGSALGALTINGATTGTTARNLTLATGAITVDASVTGNQTFSNAFGAITLLATDGGFEFANNSAFSIVMGSILGDTPTGTTVSLTAGQMAMSAANLYTGATYLSGNSSLTITNTAAFLNTASFNLADTSRLIVGVANGNLSKVTGVAAGTFLRYTTTQTTAGANSAPGTIFGTVELSLTAVNPNYVLDFGAGSKMSFLAATTAYSSAVTLRGNGTTTFDAGGNAVTFSGAVSGSNAGNKTLVFNNTASATFGTGAITDGSGVVAVTKTGNGTLTFSGIGSNFSGGLNVYGGVVVLSGSAQGCGTIYLGDPTGNNTNSARLQEANAATVAITRPIVVNAGSSGVLSMNYSNTSGSNSSSYTGGVTLNNDLTLTSTSSSNGGGTFSVGGFVINGHTLNFTATSGGWAISSAMQDGSGPGQININQGSLLTTSFSGNNANSTSPIALNAGILAVTNNFATGLGNLTIANGATLSTPTSSQIQLNNNSINIAGGGAAKIAIGTTSGGWFRFGAIGLGTAGTGATLNVTYSTAGNRKAHAGTLTMYGNSIVDVGTNAAAVFDIYGGVTDSGGSYDFTKSNIGILVLGASIVSGGTGGNAVAGFTGSASTYHGDTYINGGIVRLGITNALPTTTTVNLSSGTVLDLSYAENFSAGYTDGTLQIGSGAQTYTSLGNYDQSIVALVDGIGGPGTVTGSTINRINNGTTIDDRTLSLSGTGNYTFSGLIQSNNVTSTLANNNLGIAKTGAGGTYAFTNAGNTYTGPTTMGGGTVIAAFMGDRGVASNLGAPTYIASASLIFDGGTLQYTGADASSNRGFKINDTKTGTIDVTTNSLTISGGSVASSGVLDKKGSGTLVLTGANAYGGGTVLEDGVLTIGTSANTSGSSNVISATPQGLIASGITYASTNTSITVTGAATNGIVAGMSIAGVGIAGGTTVSSVSGDTVNLSVAATGNAISPTALLFFNSGFAANQVTVADATGMTTGQTVSLAGFAAGTTITSISGSTLILSNNATAANVDNATFGAWSNLPTAGLISFTGGTLRNGVGNTDDYSARFSNAASQQYKFDTGANNVAFNTSLSSVGGSFQKLGAGTLTFNTANTFNGGTTVHAGTIVAAHQNAFGGGALTVNNAATVRLQASLPSAVPLGSLAFGGTGKLDVTNNHVVINSAVESTLRSQLISGMAGGAWNGSGIQSSTAAASGGTRAVGYVMNGSIATVAYAAAGDTDLNGVVDTDDIFNILDGGKLDTASPANWNQGDFNYSGYADTDDIFAILDSGALDAGPYSGPPIAAVVGVGNTGKAKLIYNAATGDVKIDASAASVSIKGFNLQDTNAGDGFTLFSGAANPTFPANGLSTTDTDVKVAWATLSDSNAFIVQDLGNIALTGLTQQQVLDALAGIAGATDETRYTIVGTNVRQDFDFVYVAAPEPASLSIILLGGMSVLGRRKRKHRPA